VVAQTRSLGLSARSTADDWSERFDSLYARFERQRQSRLPLRSDCGVAGRCFSFSAWSDRALGAMTRPIEHLPKPDSGAQRLSVEICDGADAELDAFLSSSTAGSGPAHIRPRLVLGDGNVTLGAAWPASGMLALLDKRSDHAVVWLGEPDRIGVADAATLIRALVAWWIANDDCGVVHAAAVAGPRGAALLTGRGGTGKSSTAAACFQAGLHFIGDDSVFCRADTAEVFSLNTCVSLFEQDLAQYHSGLDAGAATTPGRDGKIVVDLAQVDRDRIVSHVPICAVVSLVRSGPGPVELCPAARPRVLAALAPSSVFNVPTPEQRTLSMIAALVRRIPTYELTLRGHRDDVATRVRRFLDHEESS